jgi:hypothetical protein
MRKNCLVAVLLSLPFVAAAAGAAGETGLFYVVHLTGYYGESTNAVMTPAQLKRAFAENFEANNVAPAAFKEFTDSWADQQQKIIDAQKKAANGQKVSIDRSILNIVLERPARKTVVPGEPFVTRKEAEAAKVARDAKEAAPAEEPHDGAAAAPNAAAKANDDRGLVRGEQLAMFLAIAEKRRQALHSQKGLQGGTGMRKLADGKKPLTHNPPPLEVPSTTGTSKPKEDKDTPPAAAPAAK